MFFTYILKSILNGDYYIGSCHNIEKRLKQHNQGLTKSTKKFIPWELIYKESFTARKEAIVRERQIKHWKSRKAIENLLKTF
ncbi:MAG: Excinuclease abc c subunit domain protein [Parcubacteria group bacterium GW2011_GWB1_42_6]|nr:MAG: Excinuclease abc c subunit domain protein [Parcubacteria group bacterium GW2011_GWB1_42_6]